MRLKTRLERLERAGQGRGVLTIETVTESGKTLDRTERPVSGASLHIRIVRFSDGETGLNRQEKRGYVQ